MGAIRHLTTSSIAEVGYALGWGKRDRRNHSGSVHRLSRCFSDLDPLVQMDWIMDVLKRLQTLEPKEAQWHAYTNGAK